MTNLKTNQIYIRFISVNICNTCHVRHLLRPGSLVDSAYRVLYRSDLWYSQSMFFPIQPIIYIVKLIKTINTFR